MNSKIAFGRALKRARKIKKKTQEAFGDESSRTYISSIERGVYSPTIEKVTAFGRVLDIHPLTLLCLSYLELDPKLKRDELIAQVDRELKEFDKNLGLPV